MDTGRPNSNICISSLNLQQPKPLSCMKQEELSPLRKLDTMLLNLYMCSYFKRTKIKWELIFMGKKYCYQCIIQNMLIFKKSSYSQANFICLVLLPFFNRETRKSQELIFSPIFSIIHKNSNNKKDRKNIWICDQLKLQMKLLQVGDFFYFDGSHTGLCIFTYFANTDGNNFYWLHFLL